MSFLWYIHPGLHNWTTYRANYRKLFIIDEFIVIVKAQVWLVPQLSRHFFYRRHYFFGRLLLINNACVVSEPWPYFWKLVNNIKSCTYRMTVCITLSLFCLREHSVQLHRCTVSFLSKSASSVDSLLHNVYIRPKSYTKSEGFSEVPRFVSTV